MFVSTTFETVDNHYKDHETTDQKTSRIIDMSRKEPTNWIDIDFSD